MTASRRIALVVFLTVMRWAANPAFACALEPRPMAGSSIWLAAATPTPTNSDQLRLDDLERRVNDLRDIVQLVLAPIAILIGVLALGGALGVVFSLRDQRRLSQLHELAVTSEVSSQRRSDQSYSSFLEESQKTLTLVNDTLALAKEGTQQATQTVERKAQATLHRIESDSRDLLAPLLEEGEFERIHDTDVRVPLETIAGEIRAIEGYLLLQDLELAPYSRFVKGIAQYFGNDITGALRTIRQGTQDPSVRELQLFCIYWDAYINIAIGRYTQAIHVFRSGEDRVSDRALEHAEFEALINDARFFARAEEKLDAPPIERLSAVAEVLADLADTADALRAESADTGARTGREIADIRADLLTWVAYDPGRLREPLSEEARTAATAVTTALTDTGSLLAELENLPQDGVRAWALKQADAIYKENSDHDEGLVDLELAFGRAECAFQLGTLDADSCIKTYRTVERKAIEEFSRRREQRESIELAAVALVCACRLLHLYRQTEEGDVRTEEAEVRSAYRRVQDALADVRDHRLSIKSPLQRRPLRDQEYEVEMKALFYQALGETHD